MRIRHLPLLLLSLLSVLIALAPLAYPPQFSLGLSLMLNIVGWSFLGSQFFAKRKMLIAVEDASAELGLPSPPGDLDEKLAVQLNDYARFLRSGYAYRNESIENRAELEENLRRIVALALTELNASSVQLVLFDESTGLATQSFLLGNSKVFMSQDLIRPGSDSGELLSYYERGGVMRENLAFAGINFGTLWVELPDQRIASKADKQVLYLLAVQAAVLMIDARFSNELLKMRQAGDESVRAKTGFLANLSHEIRGPLGIILNGVELVLDGLCGPITEEQRDTLAMIRDNGMHLVDLVNDVLDYAKAEAGKVSAKPAELSARELLDDLANVVRTQAMAKKHQLTVLPVDDTLGVRCDKRHARQMLINFLTNAIKYTPDGGQITLSAERVAGNRVKLSVSDTGIGIPLEQQGKVFSAFERVDDKYALAQNGTGLGMPLTRKLAEVNNGSADFTSEVGHGSTFWILLPVAELQDNRTRSDSGVVKAIALGRGERILLVDNNNQSREMLARYLKHQGFIVDEVGSGSELLTVIRSATPQLALVENEMAEFSGEEIVTLIRGLPVASRLPVILLSAKAFVFDIERFLKIGVDRCLSKPVDLSELAFTVRRLLDEVASASETPAN